MKNKLAQRIIQFYADNEQAIENSTNGPSKKSMPFNFDLLAGDASKKRFFRVTCPNENYMLVKIPTSGNSSEEIFAKKECLRRTPASIFIDVARTFSHYLSNVADVYAYDKSLGLAIITDHGDKTFDEFIFDHNHSEEKIQSVFSELFAWLFQLQQLRKTVSASFLGLKRKFSSQALYLEMKEFIDYGICHGDAAKLNKTERKVFDEEIKMLANEIADLPQTLIHRDMQSKNIMIQNDQAWIIDFQDICIGPLTYDLASLVYDPYIDLNIETQTNLIYEYWKGYHKHLPDFDDNFEHFLHECSLTAIQRLLKASARYTHFYYVRNRDTHMKYFNPAVKKALALLEQQPKYKKLHTLINKHVVYS